MTFDLPLPARRVSRMGPDMQNSGDANAQRCPLDVAVVEKLRIMIVVLEPNGGPNG